ncbi:hypothetical protein CBR_g48346 [Chara braunii]|uniref:Homeobox domain-containing protein n=1 Tax=Chara braunii TaxID=69332 RepID=A0A388K489_CHABU|nr:hypothetical protein CBR_g48346 [Chara braunii]|eukprot:GBG64878.1 hypothetical protein CBR_g48346 [Chara braunii]
MTVQQCSPSFSIPPPAGEDGLLTEKGTALVQLLQRQRMMFDLQVQELVRLVAVQQELTGSNPLKEELVSLILGEKSGGEQKGEALSTSAVKELLSVFALKDTLTKAEVRLISAANGITPAQVKEFFTSQRKCVRRLLLQRPKLEGDAEQSPLQMEGDGSNGPRIKSSSEMDPQLLAIVDKVSGGLAGESVAQMMVQLMEAEEGMAGRATLAKVLLRTKQRQSLTRLVELNCVKILGSWLLQALKEEQTSLLRSLLKVLEKLPAQKCPTVQLLAVTKNVTRLGSYFVQDIGAMAKFLISRWKKMSLLEKVVVEEKKIAGASAVWGKCAPQAAIKKQMAGETGIAARKAAAGFSELAGLKKSPTTDAMNLTKAGGLSQKRAPDLTGVMTKSTAAQQAEPPNKKLKTGPISATGSARSTSGFDKLSVSNGLLENSRQGKAAFELLQK